MSISLEQIDLLKTRANVSYEDAKEALEKTNGDLVEALIYLEKQNKIKNTADSSPASGIWDSIKHIIKKGNEIKLKISKNDETLINLPLTIAVIITVIMPPVTIAGLILALFTKHKIRFEKKQGQCTEINNAIMKVSDAVDSVSSQVLSSIQK